MGDAVLMLDELNLLPSDEEIRAGGRWHFVAEGDEADTGNPEETVVEIVSQLLQGAAVTKGSVGNREATFRISVIGDDSAALAEGEAELVEVCDRSGLKALAFLNPDRTSALTVFDVLVADLSHEFDDLDETRARRTYTLTLLCKPWPRSEEMVEDAPPAEPGQPIPPAPAPLLVDDGSNPAEWEVWHDATYGPSTTAPAGHTWVPASGSAMWGRRAKRVTMWHPRNVDATGYRFLRIKGYTGTRKDGRVSHGESIRFLTEGVERKPARLSRNRVTGQFSAWVYVGDVTVTTFGVRAISTLSGNPGVAIAIDEVWLDAGDPSYTSAAVSARLVDVIGSKPAEASIQVSGYDSAGAPAILGRETIVYTAKADGSEFQPSIADYWVSGPVRTDSDAPISGSTSLISLTETGADTFDIPTAELSPGTYQIVAYLSGRGEAGSREVRWRAQTVLDGSPIWASASGVAHPDLSYEEWTFNPLGEVVLPLQRHEDTPETMSTRLTVWAPTGGGAWFDTLLLFNISTGAVTVVNSHNTGTQRTVGVRIDPPLAERPEQTVWCDTLTAGGIPYTLNAGARVRAMGQHLFEPGPVLVWTATTANTNASVAVAYFPRWAGYAVGDPYASEPVDPAVA